MNWQVNFHFSGKYLLAKCERNLLAEKLTCGKQITIHFDIGKKLLAGSNLCIWRNFASIVHVGHESQKETKFAIANDAYLHRG